MEILSSHDVAFDPRFQICNLVEQIDRHRSRKNERLHMLAEFVEQFTISRNPPRLNQRYPFPAFPIAGIIVFHAFKRSDEGALSTLRPKPDIDPKKRSAGSRKGLDNLFGKPRKKIAVRQPGVDLSIRTVEENEIDI